MRTIAAALANYSPTGSLTGAGSGINNSQLYEDRWCPQGHWLYQNGQTSFDPVTKTSFAWDIAP